MPRRPRSIASVRPTGPAPVMITLRVSNSEGKPPTRSYRICICLTGSNEYFADRSSGPE